MSKAQYYELDLLRVIKAWRRRWWVICLAAILLGAAGLTWATWFVTPQYAAEALMYVNNSVSSEDRSAPVISSAELIAAQSLVETYLVILQTRTTLKQVIEDLALNYTYEELREMIAADQVNNTEVFRIKVTGPDPVEAERIANHLTKILPGQISSVVTGGSVRVVDPAVVPQEKVSPSVTRYTVLGFGVGAVLSGMMIAVWTLFSRREEETSS